MNLIHTSKTYTWNHLLKRYIPSVGVTYEEKVTTRKLARKMNMTPKAYLKNAKRVRREMREVVDET